MPYPQNLIFDLGGVILNLDLLRTEQAFQRLAGGPERHRELTQQLHQTHFFERFEVGDFTGEHFVETLQNLTPGVVPSEIAEAWSAMLLDLPGERLRLLGELGKSHRIFLLSNTNELHLADFRKIVQAQHGDFDFDALFEQAWYSHLIGHRKPNAAVFEYVLDAAGLSAGDTLFIDDNADNIRGASALGIRAHRHEPNSDLAASLRSAGLAVPALD